ncbi:MAG: hypothetical protein ACR2NW_00535 [Thermodesulfobacteriota bacterium]
MGFFEALYTNHPIQFVDIVLVFLITLIGLPIIYFKTGKRIKLLIKLYIVFFFLIAVYTPLFVAFIFSVFTITQILYEFMGILPESIYKVDYKDIRVATTMLPLACAVWFITSLVIVIKLGQTKKD